MAQGTLSQPGGGGSKARERKAKLRKQKEEEDAEESDSEKAGGNPSGDQDDSAVETSVSEESDDSQGVTPALENDKWIIAGDGIIRIHNEPRTTLYTPSADECPIPLEYWKLFDRIPLE